MAVNVDLGANGSDHILLVAGTVSTLTNSDRIITIGGSTIANTWTLLDGTNKVTVQLSSDTSLTPSSNAFMAYYSIKNNSEQATTIL